MTLRDARRLTPLLLGLEGPKLDPVAETVLREARPFGVLLFARNIESPTQVKKLCESIRKACDGYEPVIGVDQEGGRVQRIHFDGRMPAARVYGEWHAKEPSAALEACMLHAMILADMLRKVGANLLFGPVLDLGLPETHAVIGERAFSASPETVAELGAAYMRGVAQGGCWDCIKHAPGHGRATTDTHFELPTVDASREEIERDIAPFRELAPEADFVMTAHIIFKALDAEQPATYSPRVIKMIKDTWQTKGLVLADDIGMQALSEPYVERAQKALAAGCDVVIAAMSIVKHGMAGTVFDADSFAAIAKAKLPAMSKEALERFDKLKLPPEATAEQVRDAKKRLKVLWADGPERMGYSLGL